MWGGEGREKVDKGSWRTPKQWAEIVSAASVGAEVPNIHNKYGEQGFSAAKILGKSDFAYRRHSGELPLSDCRRLAGMKGKDTFRTPYVYSLREQLNEMKRFIDTACKAMHSRITSDIRRRWEDLAEAMLREDDAR